MTVNVSQLEAWALRRAMARMEVPSNVPVNGYIGLMLRSLDVKSNPDHWGILSDIINNDTELARRVFEMDPKAPPPAPSRKAADAPMIPSLPKEAELSKLAKSQAEECGKWVDDCIAWLKTRASKSSSLFIEAGAIWAASIVIAGRLRVNFEYESIKPHLYMLLVAPTTYYKKTTTLRAVEDLVRKVAPHLLLSSQNSPELLMYKLAGNRTANYESLGVYDRAIEDAGRQFAAQRAIITDEATRLLSDKNYMAGLVENLMEMFDARKQVERELRNDGKLIIRDSALSLFGATTPARLALNIGEEQWHDGMFARFALITPTETRIEAPKTKLVTDLEPPRELVARLQTLYKALPEPPIRDSLHDDGDAPDYPSLNMEITPDALDAYDRYFRALDNMCAPDRGLDERMKGNYGRLHILAMKVAITMAALDWNPAYHPNPVITLGHWARAQETAETWRESLHRLVFTLSRSIDSQVEQQIFTVLTMSSTPLTRREIHVQLGGRNRKVCNDAIDALLEDGMLIEEERKGTRGPTTKAYRLADE